MVKDEKDLLLASIVVWMKDYKDLTGLDYGDDDLLEGQAYIIMSSIANYLKRN